MKLFIAEKPSLARAVADVMPKPHKKHDGYIQVANGDIVTWCIGHLLEQAQPDAYDSKYKKWSKEDLPIIPNKWILVAKTNTKKQFNIVKKLIKEADVLVNLGDPDREGQILIDEMFSFCGASKNKINNALRCLVSDLNSSAVTVSLNNLKLNNEFRSLSISALARARADWLYGMNMTRMCTLQGQQYGYQGVLSVGRVQTPILGLVVQRDLDIENFVSKPFYEVNASLKTENKEVFIGKWQPSDACELYMDSERRIIVKQLAEKVADKVTSKHGKVISFINKVSKKQRPLPHSLSSLQIEAANVFGLSAQKVLDVCQVLYEKYKLITYPRSDCRYLPSEHLNDAGKILNVISGNCHKISESIVNADPSIKSPAWNDNKVSAHHAIIPTIKSIGNVNISADENNIYWLISRIYVAQFYALSEYQDKKIKVKIEGGIFISKQRDLSHLGWEVLFQKNKAMENKSKIDLPNVDDGDDIYCVSAEIIEKNTTAPKRFTDATLLSAMTGISRFVSSIEIKKILKDTDGIGTEATRAGIIELLFRRNYLIRNAKDIISTDIGRSVISSLPDIVGKPDMTAIWESQLEAICRKEFNYKSFMDGVEAELINLLAETSNTTFSSLKGKGETSKRKVYKKRPKSR